MLWSPPNAGLLSNFHFDNRKHCQQYKSSFKINWTLTFAIVRTNNNSDHHSTEYHHHGFNSINRHLSYPKIVIKCLWECHQNHMWHLYSCTTLSTVVNTFDHHITIHHIIVFHHHAFNWTNRHLYVLSLIHIHGCKTRW